MTPQEALQLLRDGNAAFTSEAPYRAASSPSRRLEIALEQHPFCVLIGCSDSRVPPELLFGRGLGELFIIRVAGNTVDRVGLGSIEYAIEHLGVPLVVVLGHERCGAVSAAVAVVRENATWTPPETIRQSGAGIIGRCTGDSVEVKDVGRSARFLGRRGSAAGAVVAR